MFAEKNEEEEEEEEEKEEEEEEEEETMMDRRGIFAFPIPHSVGGPSPSYQLTMRILPGKRCEKGSFPFFGKVLESVRFSLLKRSGQKMLL